jgi:hypothetical protein
MGYPGSEAPLGGCQNRADYRGNDAARKHRGASIAAPVATACMVASRKDA